MKAALALLDYAIELAEATDAKLHELYGKVDSAAHEALLKLKALRERVAQAAGIFAASGDDCYGALSDACKSEVDAKFAEIHAAA